MRSIGLLALCSALTLVVACSDTSPVGPSAAAGGSDNGLLTNESWYAGAGPGAMPIRVYSQNAYPGFNIDSVAAALERALEDPSQIPGFFSALAVGMATFDATNWQERAALMALEVRQQDPDVISLNEMITLDRKGFGLLYTYGILPIDFADVKTDFLGVFEEELAKQGLHYKLVDSLPLTNALVDLSGQLGLPDLTVYARYQDRDALLVRQDVGVADVAIDTFAVALQQVVAQLRGWIAADLTIRGKTWHFVDTHPDPSWPADGKTPHITELLASLANASNPVIIAGDLNLEPSSNEHAQLLNAGFVDLWSSRLGPPLGANPNGYTCCQADSLRNVPSALVKRIDYVMARPATGYRVGPVRFSIFGDDLSERTATGMWPSDHAGLFVGLVMQHE